MEIYLVSEQQAEYFEEAYPIGNGHLGAMVYGKTRVDKMSINDDTLWTGNGSSLSLETDVAAVFQEARTLVKNDHVEAAEQLIEEKLLQKNADRYLPLGNIWFEFEDGEIEQYKRQLNMQDGVAAVDYLCDSAGVHREYFASKEYDVLAVRIDSELPKGISMKLCFQTELELSRDSYAEDVVMSFGHCPTVRKNQYVYEQGGRQFVCAYMVRVKNGTKEWKDHKICIKDADSVEIYVKSYTSFEAIEEENVQKDFKNLPEYYEIKKKHETAFREMFMRNTLSLNGEVNMQSTEDRLKEFDGSDKGLCELLYHYGRYLVISASQPGTTAMNLQGIWNEQLVPPWGSRYTLNINTQMNYWPVYLCNMAECFEPFEQLVRRISENGKITAKGMYGAEGFVCHHNSDIYGYTHPVGTGEEHAAKYAFWFMASGWLACQLFESYEYTLDKKRLNEDIYPIMKQALDFYYCIMNVDSEGKYILSPSTSPENLYEKYGKELAVAEYTAMSQEIFEDLLHKTITACDVLGIDREYRSRAVEVLNNIRKPEIGEDGTICEWTKSEKETDIYHRHVSHLYFLYPGEQIQAVKDTDYCEAVRKTLEKRGDGGTGWSLAWKANLWAKLFDGEHAYKLLKRQLTFVEPSAECNYEDAGGTYPNMLCAHPPFQIDGNLGITAAMVHMLVQKYDDNVYLLPAVPKEWKTGSIKGVRLKGNLTIDLEWSLDEFVKVSLHAPTAQEIKLNWMGIEKKVTIVPNEKKVYFSGKML